MSNIRKKLYLFFVIYFIGVLAVAVFPPIVSIWNKINPHVLGLPFSQFIVILIAFLMISGLLAWFYCEGRVNASERKLRQQGSSNDY